MAQELYTGRFTTDNDEDIVVFLIGMRINKRLAFRKWLPVMKAMSPMIRELYTNKEELGFLSMESFFGLRTTVMITYWKSTEDLLAYAKGGNHLTAWREFNKKIGDNDAVGVYHETYSISKGNYEAVYRNMPIYGLGKAMPHQMITPEKTTAKKRLYGVN